MFTLVIGSNNTDKVQEIRSILVNSYGASLAVLQPSEIIGFPREIEETGSTLEQNAFIKAMAVHSATGLPCICDDTGLEVAALDDQPGVFSARFAGESATYADNRRKLLAMLDGTPSAGRTARFRTVVCYRDHFRTLFAEGVCSGSIAPSERGVGGFGYDPLFIPEGDRRTFSELSPDEKNTRSHRALALRHFAQVFAPYARDLGLDQP